jgi:hypothetical protein
VKYSKTALSVFVGLSVSSALADDIKTNSGKEYKNATVTRVEPDGVMIKFSGGLVKIPFTELPKELQQLYHYDQAASQKYAAENAAQFAAQNPVAAAGTNATKHEEKADKLVQQAMIFAVIKPFHYGKDQTTAYLQQFEKYWVGPTAYDFEWKKVGKEFTAVIDEPMPESYEEGDVIPVALYRIGHSNDGSRHPLFTTDKEKAMHPTSGGSN